MRLESVCVCICISDLEMFSCARVSRGAEVMYFIFSAVADDVIRRWNVCRKGSGSGGCFVVVISCVLVRARLYRTAVSCF